MYDYQSGKPIPDVTRPGADQPNLDLDQELADGYQPLMPGRGDGSEPWTIDSLLKARNIRYGSFALNAEIAQDIKAIMHNSPRWRTFKLLVDQAECLDMIAVKISRILVGDPDYIDNWDDIAGFATLVANRLRKENG